MPGYEPDPKLKFTFGLWTVGNIGRDPFGEPTRTKISTAQICQLLGEVGAYGVNFHDNDAIPIESDARAGEADRQGFQEEPERERPGLSDGDDESVFSDPVFQGWRVHQQQLARPRLCDSKDDARDGSRRGTRRQDYRLLGRPRRG